MRLQFAVIGRPHPLDKTLDDDRQTKGDQQGVERRDLEAGKHPVHGHAEHKKAWRHDDQGDQWVHPKTAGQLVGQVSAQKRQGKVGQVDLAQHAPRQAQTESEQAIEATDKKPGQQRLSEQLKAGKLHSSQGIKAANA